MKKIEPKGAVNKQISVKLTEAELNRFKAFCKALGMNYSEVFRAMTNQLITKESKKLGINLKAYEPEITFSDCLKPQVAQLEIFKQLDYPISAEIASDISNADFS